MTTTNEDTILRTREDMTTGNISLLRTGPGEGWIVAGLHTILAEIMRGEHPTIGSADAIDILNTLEREIEICKSLSFMRELV